MSGGRDTRRKIQIKTPKKTFNLGLVHSKTVKNKSYSDFNGKKRHSHQMMHPRRNVRELMFDPILLYPIHQQCYKAYSHLFERPLHYHASNFIQ